MKNSKKVVNKPSYIVIIDDRQLQCIFYYIELVKYDEVVYRLNNNLSFHHLCDIVLSQYRVGTRSIEVNGNPVHIDLAGEISVIKNRYNIASTEELFIIRSVSIYLLVENLMR